MISHGQNAEDVVLARALPAANGFYVDVGAADPSVASVTRHFYERGWHGINIEPRPDAVARLQTDRPRDLNLAVAAGDADGRALLYVLDADPDQSTLDPATRESLIESGRSGHPVAVPMRTLDGIFADHGVGVIDFLKIDVEGAEESVLRGLELRRWRPSVIVIEAVRPWGRQRTDGQWRRQLEVADYWEACFDGVNLFFAPADRIDLIERLVPASVLDDYTPAGVVLLWDEIARLRDYVADVTAELDRRRSQQDVSDRYARHLESVIAASAEGAAEGVRAETVSTPEPAVRPPRPARLAIIGTPRTGNTWIRRVLADMIGAVELPVHHPGDLDWDDLPHRVVVQLHWPRSAALQDRLAAEDFTVISAARHPLDVLLSMLQFVQKDAGPAAWLAGTAAGIADLAGVGPHDEAFLRGADGPEAAALLALTPQWWQTPSTVQVRYEDLVLDPVGGFAELLDATEQQSQLPLDMALAANTAERINELSGGTHLWKAQAGMWRVSLSAAHAAHLNDTHRKVFADLGY